MTVFGAIFKESSSIGKFWDLLGYFDQEDKVYFSK